MNAQRPATSSSRPAIAAPLRARRDVGSSVGTTVGRWTLYCTAFVRFLATGGIFRFARRSALTAISRSGLGPVRRRYAAPRPHRASLGSRRSPWQIAAVIIGTVRDSGVAIDSHDCTRTPVQVGHNS